MIGLISRRMQNFCIINHFDATTTSVDNGHFSAVELRFNSSIKMASFDRSNESKKLLYDVERMPLKIIYVHSKDLISIICIMHIRRHPPCSLSLYLTGC